MKVLLSVVAFTLMVVSSVSGQSVVNVAAAANVRDAMEQIKMIYSQKRADVKLNVTYGASGTFFQQICNGARYDIFLSADQDFAIALAERGLADGEVRDYACGSLALYSKSIEVDRLGLEALSDARVRRIAVANPSVATYGTRAVELLRGRGEMDALKSKIIYGDNIGTTVQYAFTQNVELAFVALSQVIIPTTNNSGHYYIIPAELYSPIIQSCAVVKQSSDRSEAQQFMEFFLSDECAAIWSKFGYQSPLK